MSVADALTSSVKVVSRAGMAEADRHGSSMAGTTHRASQGLGRR